MDGAQFRALGHQVVDQIAELLDTMRERPVTRPRMPSELREQLPTELPQQGEAAAGLLRDTAEMLMQTSLFNGHPKFFGYITSSPAPIGMLADLLADAINPNVGGWQLSPMASEIEGQTVRWLGDLIGFPAGGGLLVSGGNMANITAFFAARRAKLGQQIRAQGVGSLTAPPTVYASKETHTWLQKAADLSGLGTDCLRWIDVDARGRILTDRLREAITADRAAGAQPFMLIGTGGSVSTGAIDPLDELADLAAEEKLWFHIDGAYGAFAAALPELQDAFAGLGRADSIAVDPHKWLYAPLEAGCTLVRDPKHLQDAFSYTPDYYHFDDDEADPRINYYEVGMQNSRGFRALKVWLALRQAGREGYVQMIRDDIQLTRALWEAVDRTDELEAVHCELSIATFRYAPDQTPSWVENREAWLDALNGELLEALKASGEIFVSNAMTDGRFLLRACIVNFRTALEDVEALPEIVLRHAQTLKALKEM